MARKLAIIHTTPSTINLLKELALEMMPGSEVINLLDDSILPQLIRNGGNLDEVSERWLQYVQIASRLEVDCILNACSSIGELVSKGQEMIKTPLVRIDEPMAIEAVRRGTNIAVAATLTTTLNPTTRLLQMKATAINKAVKITPVLIDGAFRKLADGDKEGHDLLVAASLRELSAQFEIIILAQASMAGVLGRLPEETREKFLSSPRLGMAKVKSVLEGNV